MLRMIASILFILLSTLSCSVVDDDYRSEGIITGIDIRECSCCGGFFIEINRSKYRFFDIPQNSDLNLENPRFPVYVKLDWMPDPDACLGDEIIVQRITEKID